MRSDEFIIDSLVTFDQKINHIGHVLNQIANNTNSFAGPANSFITILSIVASIITIVIFLQIKEYRLTRNTQKMIMLDLMRHIMMNSAILENILANFDKKKPIEGTLTRFASLDNDLELGKFVLKAEHYETLHNLCLKIRNYNLMAEFADKHMHEVGYPDATLKKELESIHNRGVRIIHLLLELSLNTHKRKALKMEDFIKYVNRRYKTQAISSNKKFYFDSYNTDMNSGGLSSNLGATYEHLIDNQSRRIIWK